MADKIRVLVVDDSAYSRQTIKRMLETDVNIEVVGIANNGIEAITKTVQLRPDIITLDFEMPEMDGFSFLRWLMKEKPTPVIVVSSHSDAKTLFTALELGAVDFIAKPSKRASIDLNLIQDDLLKKVKGTRDFRMDRLVNRSLIDKIPEHAGKRDDSGMEYPSSQTVKAVAIGSSTGGPAALKIILTQLPSNFPAAILISQHMPRGFTGPFAERLNRLSQIIVKEAKDGDVVENGKALICPGGQHLALRRESRDVYVSLKDPKSHDRYIPSVDIMMTSASEQFGHLATGVVLTGMGNDGSQGIVKIKQNGGYAIAESEATSVVFGMPNEAIKTGSVDMVLPLNEIPEAIKRTVMSSD